MAACKLPVVDETETEAQWAETNKLLTDTIAETARRWGVQQPALLLADTIGLYMFYGTADADFTEGPATGLNIFAALKDGKGYVVGLSPLYNAVVGPQGKTLLGLIHTDDFNHYYRDA